MLITKGSPEGIFPLLAAHDSDGEARPLTPEVLAAFHKTYEDLSCQGFRVLAVAYANVAAREAYSTADERDLTLAGFLAFGDPPLPDAGETIAALKRDGVEVKIIT